jgi:hypothetical protein
MTRQIAVAIAASALIASGLQAQTRSKPDDAAAPVAPSTYDSAFTGYRSFRDEPLAPWREVNDTAHQVGGHVGVLRAEQKDAAQPAGATTPKAPPAQAMPPGMHDGNSK